MTLELTAKCNFRCPYCYCHRNVASDSTAKELDTAGWKAVLNRCAADGVKDILFTGGEALLRPDLFDIINHAKRVVPAAQLALFTNASRLTEMLIRKFKRLRIHIATSLQGLSTFSAMTGTRRNCDRILATIARAAELKWPIAVSMTITKANKDEALDMFAAAAVMGAESIQIGPVMAEGRALEHPELMITRKEWAQVKNRIRTLHDSHVPYSFCDEFICACRDDMPSTLRRKWLDPKPTPCAAGKDFGVIGVDGRYRKCLHAL